MLKQFANISSLLLIWITILHFMSVGYISMHLATAMNSNSNTAMFMNWVDKHEGAVTSFTDLYDTEHESGSDSHSHPADDDSSHTNEDLIASLHSLNRLQISADNNRIAGLLNSLHSEPHIEFLSPPPERLYCI